VAAAGGESGLRQAVAPAAQDAPAGQSGAQVTGEVVGLVEAPLQGTQRVEGDGDERIGAREQVG
jgi:hypothetical protein